MIANSASAHGSLGKEARPHHEERRVVVAPVYDLKCEEDPNGFGPIMATRIQFLMYSQFFPFAEWKETRNDSLSGACSFRQGIIRFDRLQMVTPDKPSLQLAPVRLSDQVLPIMHLALRAYLQPPATQKFVELQKELLEYLPEEANVGGFRLPS
ncbi:hypothetical protein WME91_25845 [Sorangium sp. So ce269]